MVYHPEPILDQAPSAVADVTSWDDTGSVFAPTNPYRGGGPKPVLPCDDITQKL